MAHQPQIKRSERGQALMMIVLAVVGMVGLTALAVDTGNAFAIRRHAQNAADTSALAAALAMSDHEDWNAAALARALSNGYTNDGVTNTVTVVSPPTSGAYAGVVDYIQVTIHTTTRTFFASVVGVSQLSSTVNAVSFGQPSHTEPFVFGDAIVSMNPDDCRAFWGAGGGELRVEGSGIFDNSSAADCALYQNGSGHIRAPSYSVVGGASYTSGGLLPNPPTIQPATQQDYPPNISWPDFSNACPNQARKIDSHTMDPGWWNGTFPANGVDTLNPGVYCINGDFRLQSDVTGNGVTFYMQSGDVTWNGNATINLNAQSTGAYAGLLLFAPLSNTSSITLNGSSGSHYTGTFLAPSSSIELAGGGDADGGYHAQIVGYNVKFTGNSTTHVVYNDNENYDVTIPPAVELSQ